MPLHEVKLFINGLQMRERATWMTTRWLIWTISRAMGGKDESPEEMVTFPWEREPKGDPEEEARALEELLKKCEEDNRRAAAQ